MQLIPFNRHFNEEEQDKGLKARLITRENISGIFNWLVDGFQEMAEKGLQIPEVIRHEVEQYQEQNDRIGEFIQDCLIKDMDKKHREKLSVVYRIYCYWCKENGYQSWNKRNFKMKISERINIEKYANQDHIVGYDIEDHIPSEWL